MDDIAQDLTSGTPAERVARGRAIWDRYSAQYGQYTDLADVVADLLHFADEDVPGGAETVLERAELHHSAERPDGMPRHPAPFAIADIAIAVAELLGDGWSAKPGRWPVSGFVSGPYPVKFTVCVDYENDLCIDYDRYAVDTFPDCPELPRGATSIEDGVLLELASPDDGLDVLAERCAAVIRTVTNYDPDEFDFESSASRQHHIDTGRYLRKGQAEDA